MRPAASAVGLVGSPMAPRERGWVAWFGVRGVGSLYYAAAALLQEWLRKDILHRSAEPAFYIYEMDYRLGSRNRNVALALPGRPQADLNDAFVALMKQRPP